MITDFWLKAADQEKLPKLSIPALEDTCKRYLEALEALQDESEHDLTKKVVQDFLDNALQERLKEWAKDKDR